MLELKRAVLTHAGKQIQALNIAGEDIEFTRIEVGSGRYTEDEVKEDALRDMTTLKSKNQQFGISSIKTIDGDTIVLRSVITNIDLPAGYTIRELGLYARIKGKPDTECLASISLAKVEDYMPTYDGENECRIICNYQFSVSDSDCVHLSYCLDPVALVEDVDAKVAELRKAIDEVKALRASFEACGLVRVTNSAAVTDSTGLALAATEKNASIQGTLAQKLAQLNTDILKILGAYVVFLPITVNRTYNHTEWTTINEFTYTLPQRSIFVSTVHVQVSRDSYGYIDYFFNERFGSCKCDANVISFIDRVVVGVGNSGHIIRFYLGSSENWITTIHGSEDARYCFAEHLIIPLE